MDFDNINSILFGLVSLSHGLTLNKEHGKIAKYLLLIGGTLLITGGLIRISA